MLFCVDTGTIHYCTGEKALERIFRHSECISIPIIDSKRNFKFGDTLTRSRGMVQLIFPTSGYIHETPIILDFVDVEIPELLGLDFLDGNNILIDNITNHLWSRIITNKDPLIFEDVWKI